MIYFTSIYFTLLLAVIARAAPACDDASEDVYNPTYDDFNYEDQLVLATYKVTWDATYDNPNGNTLSVACSNGPNGLAEKYPHFHNFPDFPYLGGAFDVKWGSDQCGKCWKLTDKKSKRSIFFTAIDAAGNGFNIGKKAFIALNGGTIGAGTLEAEAIQVPRHHCGF